MIQKFLRWWKDRRLSALDRKVQRLSSKVKQSQKEVNALSLVADRNVNLVEQNAKLHQALRDQNKINEELEETCAALREELRTANDITIPGLVAAHDVLVKRWESESQIYVMRAAAIGPNSPPQEM